METTIDSAQFALLIETIEAQTLLVESLLGHMQMVANVCSFLGGMMVVVVLALGFGGGR